MADEVKLLQEFEPLPEALAAAVEENGGVMPLATDCPTDCNADTSDCSSDGSSCTSDGSSCTSDGCTGDSCTDEPDPAPTFTISRITQSSARITISNPSAYYLRVLVRRAGSTTEAVDQWIGKPTSDAYDLVRLDPDTTYIVNIAYNTSQTATGEQYVGAQSFTTDPLPRASSGTMIHDGTSSWAAQQPFIWDGTAWVAYSSYIWDGTAWSPY